MNAVHQQKLHCLDFGTPEGRWSRFGSYYAMFPVEFAVGVIEKLTQPSDTIVDPFCGRGTAPFTAMCLGRQALACDINPVAWLYALTKIDPHPALSEVEERIEQIQAMVTKKDKEYENEFQSLAFCENVFGFVNAARRTLNWRGDRLDRTVMAFIVHHLQDKLGAGMSNQMRHSRALSPRYSINWWKSNGFSEPPEIDAKDFLIRRVRWRYAKGISTPMKGQDKPLVLYGDSARKLPGSDIFGDLVLTSPPYSGVTNYRSDSWLRLWAIGEGPNLPDWNPVQKFLDVESYTEMLESVFGATAQQVRDDAVWYIRSDARVKTKDTITRVLSRLLPHHRLEEKSAPYLRKTQTALYGDAEPKPGEVDLIYTPI